MLKVYNPETALTTLLQRQSIDDLPLPQSLQDNIQKTFGKSLTPAQAVEIILRDIRLDGDAALRNWSQKLDGTTPNQFLVSQEDIADAFESLSSDLQLALDLAASRIRQFHKAQPVTSWITQSMGGTVGQLVRPIQRVGLYIPAGTAPLPSTILMSAIPAQVAGVKEIALAVPPMRGKNEIAPIILATAEMLGINEIYMMGGAQAIAAMAYGTESITKVDKIFGPGNLFVTLAKRQVFGVVGIDSLAGPTETVVIADDTARPEWVAADLLAQAEHDVLAAAILLTPSEELIAAVQEEISLQLKQRQRSEIIQTSLENRGGAVLTRDLDQAVDLANTYAPEHLCLAVNDPWKLTDKVHAAGGIFVGEHSFEVLGDYVAGPSHIMPTSGSARFSSPVNVLDFIHLVSLIALDPETTRTIAPAAAAIAAAEGLDAHANSALVRL
jgi:histidinol dehydrogenase